VASRSNRFPGYTRPYQSTADEPELARLYPLNIVAPKSHAFLNTNYANEPKKRRMQGDQFVLLSQQDAAERIIEHGDKVKVYNRTGGFQRVAHITDDVRTGVVVTPSDIGGLITRTAPLIACPQLGSAGWETVRHSRTISFR
jgi:anaerobic selenocysteine-containing dehydrogenase